MKGGGGGFFGRKIFCFRVYVEKKLLGDYVPWGVGGHVKGKIQASCFFRISH